MKQEKDNNAKSLLLNDKEDAVVDKNAILPFNEAFMRLWRSSRWMILNAFLHPIYTIVNAMVLGH